MRQLVDIHNILYAESLSDFREELIRLGAYEPHLCEALLNRVLDSRYYWGRRDLFAMLFETQERAMYQRMVNSTSDAHHETPWTRRFRSLMSFFKVRQGDEADRESSQHYTSTSYRDPLESGVHRFVRRCQEQQRRDYTVLDPKLNAAVEQLYAGGAVNAIRYLLERADPETLRLFSGRYLDAETLAQRATVQLVVREVEDGMSMSGNTGRFLVYLQQGERQRMRLSFTNQASMVYYLMFLIHHCSCPACKTPVSLSANREEFMRLYHHVYRISDEKLRERVQHLLYREVDGNIRVGRENDLRRDIRRHLEEAFSFLGESFQPYAMTAATHLTVPVGLIRFEGLARELRTFCFV